MVTIDGAHALRHRSKALHVFLHSVFKKITFRGAGIIGPILKERILRLWEFE